MFRTAMLAREESSIFEELLSRFDSLSNEQMLAVGVTRDWSAKDLLAHLAYWEREAAEQVRALDAGTWSPKQRTREQVLRINREVAKANRATPRHLLREEFSLAHSEIVLALRVAPDEMEETSPLARIVRSQCVRHRGHHLAQLRAWAERPQGSS
jgi:uncharacterized damage-inducible protein DinB